MNSRKRYRFINIPNIGKTIAISSYAGKPVSAAAYCNPEDTYDQEVGERLAMARCNTKICKKRLKRSLDELNKAQADVEAAIKRHQEMVEYADDSLKNFKKPKEN